MQNILGYEIRGLINAVRCRSPGPELSLWETLNATSQDRIQGRHGWKDEEHLIPENVQWTSGTCHVVLCCYGYWNAVAPSLGRRIHLSSLSYAINLLQSQEWNPRQLNPRGCQDAEMPLLASQTASHIPSKG